MSLRTLFLVGIIRDLRPGNTLRTKVEFELERNEPLDCSVKLEGLRCSRPSSSYSESRKEESVGDEEEGISSDVIGSGAM